MCNKGWKKAWMARVQSARLQCTLCACSVFSALFGMFMTSVGVCLVLNYNIVEVDTSGLPPTLHNEEGKKVVGVILICVGVGALGLSGLVSALYFTACFSRTPDRRPAVAAASSSSSSTSDQNSERSGKIKSRRGAVTPSGQATSSNRRGNGGVAGPRPGTSSGGNTTPRAAGAGAGALPVNFAPKGGRRVQLGSGLTPETSGYFPPRAHTPPSMRSKSRHKAARHLPPRYQHRLAPHPEEEQSLHEAVSRASSAAMLKNHAGAEGHINHAAEFDEDDNEAMMTSRGDSCVSDYPSAGVLILVNETHLCESTGNSSSSEPLDSRSEITIVTPCMESVVLTVSEYMTGDRDQAALTAAYDALEVGERDDVASGGESRTSFSADSDLGSMSEEAKTSIT